MIQRLLKPYFTKSTFKISPKSVKVNLSNTLKGLKFIQISDLHIDTKTPYEEIKYLINTLNSIDADFIIISGDIIDCKIEKIKEKLVFFKDIKMPTYFVSGNHDLVYGYKKLHNIFKEYNIISLDNRYEVLKYGETKFMLWGLSDRFSKFFRIKRYEADLVKKVQEFEIPKIFIAHQPKDYKFGLNSKSSLFLSGHTHGGQIYPFHYLVRVVQPFISGLHYVKDMLVYVNSGIGSWGIKYRFLSQAEITVFEVE